MSRRTLFLVRHGAVEQQERFWGWTDVALSEQGQRQSEHLARQAAAWNPERIAGSDLLRVRQTAEPLLAASGLQLETFPDLRECQFGEWEGLTWQEIRQRDPERAEHYLGNWLTATPPGGESVEVMSRRVSRAWESIWEQPWQRLALIGHAGTNRLLLLQFLGMPLRHLFRIGQDYACWSQIEFEEGAPTLKHLNVPSEADFHAQAQRR